MFSWFQKPLFTLDEQKRIIKSIQQAEMATSGEIRMYVERRNKLNSPVDRAAKVFEKLKMHTTKERNAVLVYLSRKDRQLAVFADQGIYQKFDQRYWEQEIQKSIVKIKELNLQEGISSLISSIGEILKKEFPFDEENDSNELSNEIVFG